MLHVVDRPAPDPAAPVVVLVHGTMDRAASFARVTARLPDFRVVAYDRRGYGRSLVPGDAPASVDDHVEDLIEVITATGDRPVVAVGHSLGGNLVLAAAHRRPALIASAVVYEAPLSWTPEWPEGTAGGLAAAADSPDEAAEAFMRRMLGDERWVRLPAATREARRAEGGALVAELRSLRERAPYDPTAIAIPVVVARGRDSAAHHRFSTEWLSARLPAVEMVVLDGAGHGGHASHPEEFERLIRRAVARASVPEAG